MISGRQGCAGFLAIILLVGIAYLPAFDNGFVWDDREYVYDNPRLRTVDGLKQIWLEPYSRVQYYPLTHTAFWLQYRFWSTDPMGYHLTNVLVHALNAALVWLLLGRLGVPGAWLGGALFGLHPVQVETAAWVTELKNLLSTFFLLLAALAYLRFSGSGKGGSGQPPPSPRRPRWRFYGLSFALFSLALLSKTTAVVFPAALLVIVWWKREHLGKGDLLPLLPMFLASVSLGLFVSWIESHHLGARGGEFLWTPAERILIAGRAWWFYLQKLLLPTGLSFIYPRWEIDGGVWWQYLYPLALALFLALLWFGRKRWGKGPLTAFLFFSIALAPTLGLVNFFFMVYSFVGDHFQYLACAGPLALAAAGISIVSRRLVHVAPGAPPERAERRGRAVFTSFGVALLLLLGSLTWRQSRIYQGEESLWRDVARKAPLAWMAHHNLGLALYEKGDLAGAAASYRRALELKPDYARTHNNLAAVLDRQGRPREAMAHYLRAIEYAPDSFDAHNNLGVLLVKEGKAAEARASFLRAVELKPDSVEALYNLGVTLASAGRPGEAASYLRRVLEIDPDDAGARKALKELRK